MGEEIQRSGDSSEPSHAEPGGDSPPSPTPSARISRRGLLIAIGGLALGTTPVLAPLVGKAAGSWGGPGVEPGEALSEERLQAVLDDGLRGSLPIYLPNRLPSGWKPAPYQPDAASEHLGEAVFINPALLPGVFYRVGYTSGDPGYDSNLITLTVRKQLGGATPPTSDLGAGGADADGARAGGTNGTESVTGDYVNLAVPNEDGLDILVQGRVGDRTAVRKLATSVVPV